MREYLFRGKRKDNGEWVEGGIIPLDAESGYVFIVEPYLSASTLPLYEIIKHHTHLVDPETVGQYTGLRDCKRTAEYPEGQMIFEGDVIKVERDLHCGENKKEREIFNGVVWYDDKHTCFGIKSKKYRCLPIHRFKGDYSAIIGNIHDNPELLKEGGEE